MLVVIELMAISFLSSSGSMLLCEEELVDELWVEVREEIVDLREPFIRWTTALKWEVCHSLKFALHRNKAVIIATTKIIPKKIVNANWQ